MRVAILGAGAMGCRFGAGLASIGVEVQLLDGWAEHIEAINARGLLVRSEAGEHTVRVPAGDYASYAETADVLLVLCKATHTRDGIGRLDSAVIGPGTAVLTLQNGLGNVETLRELVDPGNLYAGVTTVGAELVGPGRIRALGGGQTRFAPLESSGSRGPADAFAQALRGAGFDTTVSADAGGLIWAKVAFNCVLNPMCAVSHTPVGALRGFVDFRELAEQVLREVAAVAACEGVRIDQDALICQVLEQLDTSVAGRHVPSMLQDLLAERPTEIDFLNGEIARRAAAHGLSAPVNATMAKLVRLLEWTHPQRIGAVPVGDGPVSEPEIPPANRASNTVIR